MLPAGQHVREVYLGPGGIIENANAGTLLIDCSTIDVETAREVAAAAEAKGLLMLDAPVSGGVGGATAGTLTFMVGGSERAFERAQSILQVMGKTIVHAGGAGNGQAAKICNNMILGVSMIAVSEAFVLAEKLGLDKQKLFDIASKSSGPVLVDDELLPGARAGADLAGEPRLSGRLHRRDDAEGSRSSRRRPRRRPAPRRRWARRPPRSTAAMSDSGEAARDFSGIVSFIRGSSAHDAERPALGDRGVANASPQSVRELSGVKPRALRAFARFLFRAETQATFRRGRQGKSTVTNFDYIRSSINRSPSEINSMFILQFKLILDHAA